MISKMKIISHCYQADNAMKSAWSQSDHIAGYTVFSFLVDKASFKRSNNQSIPQNQNEFQNKNIIWEGRLKE